MESLSGNYQLICAVFFVIIGALNTGIAWFRGRHQRQEDQSIVGSHQRVLTWYFLATVIPFVTLFLGAEVSGLNIFKAVREASFNHSVFILFSVVVFFFAAGFSYYIFVKDGAAELVRLSPIFRVQPAGWNTVKTWKCLGALAVPIQLLSFSWVYNFCTHILVPASP